MSSNTNVSLRTSCIMKSQSGQIHQVTVYIIIVELSRRRQKAPSKEQPQTFLELFLLNELVTTISKTIFPLSLGKPQVSFLP